MLLECRNCGAPLDIEVGKQTAKCRYCKATSRTDSLRTVSPTTPPNWQPPPVWVPPANMDAASVPLQYSGAAQRTVVGISIGVTLLFLCFAIGGALLSARSGSTSPGTARWNGTTPLICTNDEKLSFSDINALFAEGGAVIASGHCQITLTRCHLVAPSPISVSENARIRIVGGEVRASIGGAAIAAIDDGAVVLEDGATVTGPISVVATMRSIIDARGGSLVGIVSLDGNAQVLQSPAASGASAAPQEPRSAAPLKAPARPRAPLPTVQAPPPPPPGPCGCRASDLMCAMKCSNSK